MSFSDWDLIELGEPAQQSAQLHSTLTPQLSIGSTYCRSLFSSLNFGNNYCGFAMKSTSYDGNFYNIPNTKAIRMQGYLRLSSTHAGSGRTLWLGIKTSDNTIISSGGYGLGLSGNTNISLFLRNNTITLDSAASDTWYGLRIEVYPLGSAADRIKCFKETSPGSNEWQLLAGGDITLANTDSNYTQWGENRRNGFNIRSNVNGPVLGYVDQVSISLIAAPTPIP